MLGFLNNIDLSGFGALSSDISSGDLFNRFRSALVPGLLGNTVSDSQIQTVINYVYANYDVVRLSSPLPDNIAASIKSDLTNVVQSNIPANYWTTVSGVIDQLQSDGYAVVPKGYGQAQAASNGGAQSGASAASTSGGFWSQVASAPASVAAAITGQARPAPQTRTISRVRQQTPAEKKRMMWILGVGGALFAVAIVALAVSD